MALARLFEDLPADQPAPDLRGPGADLVQLRVAQQAADFIDAGVNVAKRLARIMRHPWPGAAGVAIEALQTG